MDPPSAPPSSRPRSAPPRPSGRTFLYASTWMPASTVQKMYETEFHVEIDGLGIGEKSSLCSKTVARRMKKLLESRLPLHAWNLQNVVDWLEYVGLHQHRELFKRADMNGATLKKLTSEHLKTKVGIRSYGHRQTILEHLSTLISFMSQTASNQDDRCMTPSSPKLQSLLDTPRCIIPADVPTEELLGQLRAQRAQWVRDREHLMAMLQPQLNFLSENPANWSIRDVCTWIDHIGLSSYRKNFAHGSINGKLLVGMTLATLESEVGMQSLEHRRSLMSKLKGLMEASAEVDEDCVEENAQDVHRKASIDSCACGVAFQAGMRFCSKCGLKRPFPKEPKKEASSADICLHAIVQILPGVELKDYYTAGDRGVVTKLLGAKDEDSKFLVTFERTGKTTGLTWRRWPAFCKIVGQASIELNTRVRVLPGIRPVQPKPDLWLAKDMKGTYTELDLGTVTQLEGFRGETDKFQIKWDRTGKTTTMPFDVWPWALAISGKARKGDDSWMHGQVRGHMRECDFSIMRLDQRMAVVKKSLGIDEPHTLEYVGAQEQVESFRSSMSTGGAQEGPWWERHYKEHEKREDRLGKRVKKALEDEEAQKKLAPLLSPRPQSARHGIFMVGHL